VGGQFKKTAHLCGWQMSRFLFTATLPTRDFYANIYKRQVIHKQGIVLNKLCPI